MRAICGGVSTALAVRRRRCTEFGGTFFPPWAGPPPTGRVLLSLGEPFGSRVSLSDLGLTRLFFELPRRLPLA